MGLSIDLRVNDESVGWAWVESVGGAYEDDRTDYEIGFWPVAPRSPADPPERMLRLIGFDRTRGAVALASEALGQLDRLLG